MSMTYAVDGDVAVVTIDDGKLNAMAQPFFDELNGILDRAERERPGAVVLTGRPGVMSAGLDLKLLPTLGPDGLRTTLIAFGQTMLRLFMFPIPTVAAMSGHAIAGGALLSFGCDLRVMADGPYRIQMNEVAIGLALPTWANTIVESVVDVRWRTEMVLHARTYSPVEALECGFINELCSAENLLARARELAAPLAKLDRTGYAATKRRTRIVAVRHAESTLVAEMSARPLVDPPP